MERLSRNCSAWGRSFTWTWKGTASPGSPSTQVLAPRWDQHPKQDPRGPSATLSPGVSFPSGCQGRTWAQRPHGQCGLSQPSVPPHLNQGPSTPLSQPQHMSTHLVGVSLEDRGEGGHGTLPPASEHGGADQGPLLRSREQSQTPAPGLQSSPPDPPKLTSSRTRVHSGMLRVFRGPSLPGAGTAGTSLAGGRQRVSSAAGLGGCGDPLPHTHRLGAAGSWHSSAGSPEK